MAESAVPSTDIEEHRRTYQGFTRLTMWVSGLIALTLILMAIFLL